eukprot:TRINITY_DN3692_c0_g2_i3.p1 TRINITY_DN3692_c0_g2~~TRINITY_DN3692_c0_g2_i3.p1  ORF type:complete len:1112 (-),score=293.52 TRINITY_DN3692_c0_g2_i3:274-3609(-)
MAESFESKNSDDPGPGASLHSKSSVSEVWDAHDRIPSDAPNSARSTRSSVTSSPSIRRQLSGGGRPIFSPADSSGPGPGTYDSRSGFAATEPDPKLCSFSRAGLDSRLTEFQRLHDTRAHETRSRHSSPPSVAAARSPGPSARNFKSFTDLDNYEWAFPDGVEPPERNPRRTRRKKSAVNGHDLASDADVADDDAEGDPSDNGSTPPQKRPTRRNRRRKSTGKILQSELGHGRTLRGIAEALNKERMAFTAAGARKDAQIAALEKQVAELRQQRQQWLKDQGMVKQGMIKSLSSRSAELSVPVEDLHKQEPLELIALTDELIATLRQQLVASKSKTSELEVQLRVDGEQRQLPEHERHLEQQPQAQQDQQSDDWQRLHEELADLRRTVQQQEATIAGLRTAASAPATDLSDAPTHVDAAAVVERDLAVQIAEDQRDALQSDVFMLRLELAAVQEQLSSAREVVVQLSEQVSAESSDMERLENELNEAQRRAQESVDGRRAAEGEVRWLKADLQQTMSALRSAERAAADLFTYQHEIEALRAVVEESLAAKSRLEAEVETLRKDLFEAEEESDRTSADLRHTQRTLDEVRAQLARGVAGSANSEAADLSVWAQGAECFAREQYEQALSNFGGVSQPNSRLWFDMGMANFCLARYTDAIASFSRAVDLQADLVIAHHMLGTCCYLINALASAAASFASALEKLRDADVIDYSGQKMAYKLFRSEVLFNFVACQLLLGQDAGAAPQQLRKCKDVHEEHRVEFDVGLKLIGKGQVTGLRPLMMDKSKIFLPAPDDSSPAAKELAKALQDLEKMNKERLLLVMDNESLKKRLADLEKSEAPASVQPKTSAGARVRKAVRNSLKMEPFDPATTPKESAVWRGIQRDSSQSRRPTLTLGARGSSSRSLIGGLDAGSEIDMLRRSSSSVDVTQSEFESAASSEPASGTVTPRQTEPLPSEAAVNSLISGLADETSSAQPVNDPPQSPLPSPLASPAEQAPQRPSSPGEPEPRPSSPGEQAPQRSPPASPEDQTPQKKPLIRPISVHLPSGTKPAMALALRMRRKNNAEPGAGDGGLSPSSSIELDSSSPSSPTSELEAADTSRLVSTLDAMTAGPEGTL